MRPVQSLTIACLTAAAALFATGTPAGAQLPLPLPPSGPVSTTPQVSAADQAAAAEMQLKQPNGAPNAIQTFDKAIDAFATELPLTIRTVTFADSIQSYGQYQARASMPFQPGDNVHIYIALAGYASRPISTGYRIEIGTGLEIMGMSGAIIAREDDYGHLMRDTSVEDHQAYFDMPLTLPDLKPGAYNLHLTLRDVETAKSVETDLPFTIMPQS